MTELSQSDFAEIKDACRPDRPVAVEAGEDVFVTVFGDVVRRGGRWVHVEVPES